MPNPEFKDFQSPHEASIDRLVDALDRAYHRPGLLMWRSFLQGFMTAVGAFFGAIIIAIIVGYVVHLLGGIDFFQPILDKLQDAIVQSQIKSLNNLSQ